MKTFTLDNGFETMTWTEEENFDMIPSINAFRRRTRENGLELYRTITTPTRWKIQRLPETGSLWETIEEGTY